MTEEWWRQYKKNKDKNENKFFSDVESELKRKFKNEKHPDEKYSMCKTDNNYWKHYRASENLDDEAVSLTLCKDVGCDLMYCQDLTFNPKTQDKNMYGCTDQYSKLRECYLLEKRKFFARFPQQEWLKDKKIIPDYIEKQLEVQKQLKGKAEKVLVQTKVLKLDESKLMNLKMKSTEDDQGYY